jgi:AbrB family looped-hinge helix DNA binding protein
MVVSTKGQITLPVKMRSKFGIRTGDRIIGEFQNGAFVIKKPRDFFSMRGSFSLGKIPDNEEDLLTPENGKSVMDRE